MKELNKLNTDKVKISNIIYRTIVNNMKGFEVLDMHDSRNKPTRYSYESQTSYIYNTKLKLMIPILGSGYSLKTPRQRGKIK